MHILVTGGAGYIGSHTVLTLLENGHEVSVIDNFCNSSEVSLQRVKQLTNKSFRLYEGDVADKQKLVEIFEQQPIDAVIHFAGLKAVGESVEQPLKYYQNNLFSTITLCEVMERYNVKRLVSSSSATVYGDEVSSPIPETAAVHPINPYAWTKVMIEQILRDLANSKKDWQISILRYFNPIGADSSGQIGEDPNGIPNNLLPIVARVAVGKLKELSVYGSDYPTPDGTGIRDYIHVVDLGSGHLAALNHPPEINQASVYNLGSGQGHSVLEVIATFEKVSGQSIPYRIVSRRPGDVAISYADVSKSAEELGWKTKKTLEDACRDSWNWQSKNPDGYHPE